MPPLDFRNVNSLWGSVLAETLARLGLRTAVVSPGSRSTPLVFALARHPQIDAIPVLDERSAGFFALGLAKRQRRPVALVCTSGTAGANYFPAVIEAHESGVPLLVLTADRPPELRDCASGQTIDQQKLYGDYVSFYHELAVPEASLPRLAYLRQLLVQAWERAQSPSRGVVHLNCPFRDPLPPLEDGTTPALAGSIDETFFSHLSAEAPASSLKTVWQRPTTARGLIVAGPVTEADPALYAATVGRLSNELGWPVLADALSPLRHHASNTEVLVTTYDAFLRSESLARELTPRFVLCLGGWPTSKTLRSWLERSQAEILLIAASPANRDALHGRARQIVLPVEALRVEGKSLREPRWLDLWKTAERSARSFLDERLEQTSALFEGKAAWLLAGKLPENATLVVANSMPVRDLEYLWPASDGAREIVFNRGANGIDGTLSTALGAAHESGRPTILLTGDLAILHDANGFLLRPQFRGSLTIVLINNRGGGIFEHLPVAAFEPTFETYFATPQEADFALLCAAHGVAHEKIPDWPTFAARVSAAPTPGIRLLELATDRKADAASRKTWFAEAARCAAAAAVR